MNPRRWWPTILVLACPSMLLADDQPPYQSDFPPEEFRARRDAVFDRIGERSVAIVAGAVDIVTPSTFHVSGLAL